MNSVSAMERTGFKHAIPWYLILMFVLFTTGIIFTGILYYKNQRLRTFKEKYQDLEAITTLKTRQIEQWYSERMGDAALIRDNEPLKNQMYLFLNGEGNKGIENELQKWMESLSEQYDYRGVLLADTDNKVRLTAYRNDTVPGPIVNHLIHNVLDNDLAITDIHWTECVDYLHMDLLVSLRDETEIGSDPFGTLIMRIDPRKVLYPLVQSWPVQSRSSETLIIRPDDDSVVFLNDLRHMGNTALRLKLPLKDTAVLAVQAVREKAGIVRGRDYRNVEVIGFVKHIRQLGWYMIAKTDIDEIEEPLKKYSFYTLLITLLLVVINAGIFGFWIWNQRVRLYRRVIKTEQEKKALEANYEYLIKYANDIITLVDKDFRLVYVNDRAVDVYGYPKEELIGKDSRLLKAGSSRSQVPERRKILDTSGHSLYETMHVRKDGKEFPVEVSSRVIEIEGTKFYQAISRDISERKSAEESLALQKRIGDIFLMCPNEDMYFEVLKLILEKLKSPFGVFGYIDQEGALVVPTMTRHIWDKCDVPEKSIVFPRNTWGNSSWPRAIREKKGNLSNNISQLTPEGHVTLFRHISFPILFQGDVIGLFQVANKESDYTEDDMKMLEYISDYIAPILSARLLREWTRISLISLTNRQDAILSAVPDIIMEVDVNKTYTWANNSGYGFFGDDVIGKEAAFYFEGTQDTYQNVRPLFNGSENVIYVESWQRRKDGQKRLLGWWCRVLKDEEGKVTGALSSARDITEQKWAEEEIRKLNEELEQRVMQRTNQLAAANKELEAFSYSVSHDLRAPLRSIHGYTNILSDEYGEKLDDEGKRICSIISSSTTRMGQLIDDLLNFSRIGRASMNPAGIDMKILVTEVADELAGHAGKDKAIFRIGALCDATGDATLIRLVWYNLLSNALKYSSKNPAPVIMVESMTDPENVTYSVKDNGVGFDMQYYGKLFGVFQRLHSVKEFEGNGVGLAIVKRIIHKHNGKVWANAEPDKGAEFFFSLPLLVKQI
ncbi:MAG: PAS domain S-box protein [Bacteroidota bacterium]